MAKRIVILFDISIEPPVNHDYSEYLADESWESEKAVFEALKELGHEATFVGVCGDLSRLIHDLQHAKPDLVFNLCEAFKGKRDFEPGITSVLDMLEIPYTGSKTLGLSLCQDKALSKKILSHHRLRVPKWVTSNKERPIRGLKNFAYPAFVKPLAEEGSEGISKDSLTENERDCLDRVKYLHEKYKSNVIIEEFIGGRELYVGVLGFKRPEVFPVRELCFDKFPEDEPKFATFKAKWDDQYRKKWGIRNDFAKDLSKVQVHHINDMVKRAYGYLNLSGYARFDLRLSETGELVIIEANPNPSLGPEDDFALSAQKAGFKYKELIQKIVDMA